MTSEREVLRCDDCPMKLDWEYGSIICGATTEDLPCEFGEPPPSWCPLRQGPITIRLKEGA